jgi:hypothetical protein
VADLDFPDDLIELERSAWVAIQDGTLTVDQARAVQERITEWAAESGLDRHTAEMALKRAVRHTPAEA